MILRLQSFFAGLLAVLTAALLALGAAQAKPASGGYQLFEPVALEHQHAIQLASLGNFDYHAKVASECCNAPNKGPRITIRDHYEHHKAMTDDLKLQLRDQGYRVSDKEISFGSSCGTGRCRPDIVYETPDGKWGIIEVKTGNADLTIRQSEIYPQINSGDAIPRGDVARRFGLDPGVPLRDQGYPNGIPIEIRTFPGAGQ
ncbi:hypothetical protein RKLH11_4141 [Rhodobacteraceae bacterium KLH11]|nr:hypothetical protein RKLH11_4141 [Rhodobacteraceae bacterium KLH11]